MTLPTMAGDAVQARIFLDHLDAEIDVIAASIETVDALTECALQGPPPHRPADAARLRPCARSCTRCADSSMRLCFGFPR